MATVSADTPSHHNSNSHPYPIGGNYIEQGVLPSRKEVDDGSDDRRNQCNTLMNDTLLVPMEQNMNTKVETSYRTLKSKFRSYPICGNYSEHNMMPSQNQTDDSDDGGDRKNLCDAQINDTLLVGQNMNIKMEPSIDIDDSHVMDDENSNSNPLASPKIRLTPTNKLMATSTTLSNTFKVTKKYACPYENCTKSYGKSSHLRSHLTWHTGIKPYVCQEPGCGKGFTRSDELNRHTRTHTGEKPFECIQCTKKFSRSDHLSKHLATHAKQQNNQTAKNKSQGRLTAKGGPSPAPSRPPSPSVLAPAASRLAPQAVAVTRSKNPCIEGMHFLAALTDHSTDEPPEDLTDEAPITTQPIKIKVEKPDYSDNEIEYGSYTTLQDDLDSQSHMYGKMKSSTTTDALEIPFSPSMLVPEVKMESTTHYDNDIDNNYNHIDDDDEPDDDAIMPEANLPPFPEDVKVSVVAAAAAAAAANAANAALSVGPGNLTYDPSRPHKCTICPKVFKRQDDVNRHLRCHTNEKPYVCSECDRAFKRSDYLKKHMNVHTRLR